MSSFAIAELPGPYPLVAIAAKSECAQDRLSSAPHAEPWKQERGESLPAEWPPCSSDPRARILELYDEYRPRLFRYLSSMHLRRETAEEIIQETFMRLTTVLLKEAQIENVQGWIVRVAHNLAIDTMKRNASGTISGEDISFLLANRADPALNPEEVYVHKEKTKRIHTALASLKPQHRECFQMRARGYRYKTIGEALGISEQRAAFVVKQAAIQLAALCG